MILAVCLAYQKRWIVSSEIEGLGSKGASNVCTISSNED